METKGNATRLRIYFSSTDKAEHQLLSERLVTLAHDQQLAGVTVLKGILGFGASSVIHSYKFWEVSDKVPVIVELVDDDTKISGFVETIQPLLESMRYGCLMTREQVQVILYKSGNRKTA